MGEVFTATYDLIAVTAYAAGIITGIVIKTTYDYLMRKTKKTYVEEPETEEVG